MIKPKIESEKYKYCLKAKQIENKLKVLEANNYDGQESKQKHEQFLKDYGHGKDSKVTDITY